MLTFPRLQENRVGHDIFNLHCQNVSPEQSRYISLSGKRRFFWSNVPTTVRLLHAHGANAALAHSRCLIVVVVPLHCKTGFFFSFFFLSLSLSLSLSVSLSRSLSLVSNPTYGAVWLRRGLLAFTACLPSLSACLPSCSGSLLLLLRLLLLLAPPLHNEAARVGGINLQPAQPHTRSHTSAFIRTCM